MKVFALYNKKNEFIASFPTRKEAEEYGKVFLSLENGWEYSIKEKFIHNSPQYPYTTLTPKQTIPCNVGDVAHPFTIDYSQKPQTNENLSSKAL